MKFGDARAKIREEDSKLTEQVVAVGRLIVGDDWLEFGGRRFRLTEKGLKRLCVCMIRNYISGIVEQRQATITLFTRGPELVRIGKGRLDSLREHERRRRRAGRYS